MSTAHIPLGREDLWRRQEASDRDLTRIGKGLAAAIRRRDGLVAALGWDDPLADDADGEVDRLIDEHNRAVAVADRIFAERTAGLSSWIDHDPTAPVCAACRGAGCQACRGWGREYREPIPVWSERDQEWVDPATGRTVDLLADPPPTPTEPRMSTRNPLAKLIDTIDRKITEAQTCPGCGCNNEQWSMTCTCLRRDCPCAGGESSDIPVSETDPALADVQRQLNRARWLTGEEREQAQERADDAQEALLLDRGISPAAAALTRAVRTCGKCGGAVEPWESHCLRCGDFAKPPPDLADQRRGRWYDTDPITTTTSTGAAAMASIEEVRAGIAAANEKANEGLGALQQAHASLEQAQGTLMRATEGSGQADVSEANGLLAQAVGSIEEVRQQVSAAISAAESVANRL